MVIAGRAGKREVGRHNYIGQTSGPTYIGSILRPKYPKENFGAYLHQGLVRGVCLVRSPCARRGRGADIIKKTNRNFSVV